MLLLVLSIAVQATATEYRVLVDDHSRPLPGQPPSGWYYNCMGGDRGLIRDATDPAGGGVAAFSKPSSTIYRGTLQRMIGTDLWEFFGFWQSLGRPISQKHQWSPAAVFHPLIPPKYQGQLIGVDVLVNRIASPAGRSDLTLKLELKGFDGGGGEISRAVANYVGRAALTQGSFPRVFSLPVDPRSCGEVGVLTVVLDRARPGDSLDVDDVTLRVQTPQIPPNLEPLLFSLAMLLDNYDEESSMVQDRANFPDGDFENVTATAKLAKLLALGIKLNLVAGSARDTVDDIAKALLHRVPRGPAGLWPHFTENGGTARVAGTEWPSGDTAYAALDVLVALKLIGDPSGQIPECIAFLRSIDWAALHRPGQGYSHGFDSAGHPLAWSWRGFGMETLGVQWAALVGGGPLSIMDAPPSDNGSGFILHAGYPVAPAGLDRWKNDWSALRRDEVNKQLSWYADASHPNPFLASKGLFGLSAAECPEGWNADAGQIYQAYGMGGHTSGANDGNRKVVAPHYSGMVAALVPAASANMWARLKQLGLVSPMNMVDSLAMNPHNGQLEVVNFLKGSWNLALFAEGWMMAQPGAAQFMETAVAGIPELNAARNRLLPRLSVTPASRTHSSAGANGQTIAVTANGPWTASTNRPWIAITSGRSGTGNGTVTYVVAANGGAIRSGAITVAGDGASRTFAVNQWPAPATPGVSAEGDVDGDGMADLSVFHSAAGNWHVLFSTGAGWVLPWGWSATVPVPADYNGDGMLDFAVYHPATGSWHIQESGSVQSRTTHFGWSATMPLPGDYDGDGKADLAVFHPAEGRWHFLCTAAGRSRVQWGWSSAIPVPADYDGDGATDLAVYHPASGLWQILKSSTGGAVQKQWGWSTAVPVPADYDGDGKADIAVFHRASGTWRISCSGGGSRTKVFGWAATIPVAADYDGDGAADLAVYHPATGNWHILKSTTGGILVKNWGWSTAEPTLLYPQIHAWFGLP